MKHMRFLTFVICCCLFVGLLPASADVRLPAVIGSHMVLQQQMAAPIWGWADAGEAIEVTASWDAALKTSTVANAQGAWKVTLATPKAGGPYIVTIKGDNTLALDNVLVGEVWVCSGQSNMEFAVASMGSWKTGVTSSDQVIAEAAQQQIRLFTVKKAVTDTPQTDCKGAWAACTPESVKSFTAVGYLFGLELHQKLGVPVGLIHTSWGGTPAQSWTKRSVLEANPDFGPLVERADAAVEHYPEAMESYRRRLSRWRKVAKELRKEGKKAPKKPQQPGNPMNAWYPSSLYNAMIAPLIPYGIQGAIWYQGESNRGFAEQYQTLFPAMIQNWRDDWGQGDFPFNFVQIAPFTYNDKVPSGELREAQMMTLALPNTGMATTMDIGNLKDIHPRNKQDVAHRLALWARANTYGEKELVYTGPLYQVMRVEGDSIRLAFEGVGSGLVARDGDLKHFMIAGEDQAFVAAKAVIDGKEILVSCASVKNPVAVRYAWEDPGDANLFNKEGLPASSFRTDDWPGVTSGKR